MPPITLFVMALAGIAVLVFAKPGAFLWLRPSRSLARVRPSIHRDEASARSAIGGGICVRTTDATNGDTAADALDLVRMDDDGGWQMAAGDASAARDKTRVTNKAAFRS